jgi:hypothetical protein
MINAGPLAGFRPLGDGRLVRPIYRDYAFGNLPNTIEYLLTGAQRGTLLPPDCFNGSYPDPDKVVLFFVDSFGWQFWQHYHPRFRATRLVVDKGTLTPVSALFPTTTAASVSTMNLGVLPSRHALYEWNIYIPAFGEVIQSLAFAPLGRHLNDTCLNKGYDPAKLLEVHETVHQRLAKAGVRSIQFAHRNYATSAYNRMVSAGAEIVRHSTPAEGLVQLKEALLGMTGKAWLNFYWGALDAIAHVHGPGSTHHAAEVASFWRTFDEIFQDVASAHTLYLFTADHGHVYADPKQTLYLNERFPELPACLARSHTHNPIYPNGSPRDIFLHLRPERCEEVLSLLGRELCDLALVMPMEAALGEGLFGPEPACAELHRRLGDVLILPYLGNFIWWREPGIMQNDFYGHHGGLTREELITVVGAIDAL